MRVHELGSASMLASVCSLAAGAAVCGAVPACGFPRPADVPDRGDGGTSDAHQIDDATPSCKPTDKFMNPMPVPGVAMPGVFEQSPRLSPDELTIYFSGYGGSGGSDANLYIARRSTRTDAFDTPMPIPALNTSSNEFDPTVSTDSLSIWFSSDRIQQQGSHLYISTRTSAFSQFGMPGLATINASDTTRSDSEPFLTLDGQELWFISDRSGGTGFDIWRASRVSDGFAAPSLVPELSSMGNDFLPTLSADRLTVYFASDRVAGGTQGGLDIWTAHRSTVGDGFPMPHLVDELNTTANDLPGWLSTDNCRLYGATMSASSSVLFIATRQP